MDMMSETGGRVLLLLALTFQETNLESTLTKCGKD